jgi:hypothetical protein
MLDTLPLKKYTTKETDTFFDTKSVALVKQKTSNILTKNNSIKTLSNAHITTDM